METGKLIFMIAFLLLGVLVGSTVGYNVGKASGIIETTSKIQKEQIDQLTSDSSQTASAYGNIQTDPLQDVRVNPFE